MRNRFRLIFKSPGFTVLFWQFTVQPLCMVKDKSLKLNHKGVTICVLFETQLETNTLFDLGYIILDFERFLCPLYALFMGGSRSIVQVPPARLLPCMVHSLFLGKFLLSNRSTFFGYYCPIQVISVAFKSE